MYLWFLFLHFMIISTFQMPRSFFNSEFYPYVSTKTDYETVHGKIERPKQNCKPTQIWGILRHGTRHPSIPEVKELLTLQTFRDEIIKNHKQNHGRLHPEKLKYLKNWHPDQNMDEKSASKLTIKGKNVARRLGVRVKQAFPELTINDPNEIKSHFYVFKSSNAERTIETLKAFAEGFFNNKNIITPVVTPESDKILQPYLNCPAWNSSYEAKHFNDERDKFTLEPVFQSFIKNISSRLGFNKILTFKQIFLIYNMCRYELAWNPKKGSTWCTVFLKEEMKMLEFSEDLSYYHNCGPGRLMSGKLGCHGLSDMFEHFKKLEVNNPHNQLKGIFYVGHTLSVQMLMMALKVNDEEQIFKSNNYHLSNNRKYRTSIQGPFSSNLLAVFYKCKGEKKPNKVMFYLCEKPLILKYCKGRLCDWEDLKKKFQPDVDKCTLDICKKIT